ncbi:MAG: hypothetical protein HYX87_04485 [Chloroflexi bacterium]|nr:hypothetical protein [Chloroflexota bacterium]
MMSKMAAQGRPAFYALQAGAWRDYITLLHPPYTAWHLSYVVLGAVVAPGFRIDRLILGLIAFFLAVGMSAHALDELKGRPLKTQIPRRVLWALAGVGALGALSVGIWGSVTQMHSMWWFVGSGTFVLLAYNLELFHGRFHTDFWFALAWGAFPFAASYWANAEGFSAGAGLLTIACFAMSLAQRKLSTYARTIRRKTLQVEGTISYLDGRKEPLDAEALLVAPELALRILAAMIISLSVGLLLLRL